MIGIVPDKEVNDGNAELLMASGNAETKKNCNSIADTTSGVVERNVT